MDDPTKIQVTVHTHDAVLGNPPWYHVSVDYGGYQHDVTPMLSSRDEADVVARSVCRAVSRVLLITSNHAAAMQVERT